MSSMRLASQRMVIDSALSDGFVSRTYLVGDGRGKAFLVDAGGPVDGLLERVATDGLELTHVLLTHHHYDHVSELGKVRERHPDAEVLIHPTERDLVDGVTGTVEGGQTIDAGGLDVEVLH